MEGIVFFLLSLTEENTIENKRETHHRAKRDDLPAFFQVKRA